MAARVVNTIPASAGNKHGSCREFSNLATSQFGNFVNINKETLSRPKQAGADCAGDGLIWRTYHEKFVLDYCVGCFHPCFSGSKIYITAGR
nr:MAG TPA: hypothetical protein [Caudoviricetes sp.]